MKRRWVSLACVFLGCVAGVWFLLNSEVRFPRSGAIATPNGFPSDLAERTLSSQGILVLGGAVIPPPYDLFVHDERLFVNDEAHLLGPAEWDPAPVPSHGAFAAGTPQAAYHDLYREYTRACLSSDSEGLTVHRDALVSELRAVPGVEEVKVLPSGVDGWIRFTDEDSFLFEIIDESKQASLLASSVVQRTPSEVADFRAMTLQASQQDIEDVLAQGGLVVHYGSGLVYDKFPRDRALDVFQRLKRLMNTSELDPALRERRLRALGFGAVIVEELNQVAQAGTEF